MTEKLPKWVKDPRELGMIAQWPEDWKVFHEHGLEWLLASGQVQSGLFTEALGGDADKIREFLPGRDDERPWMKFVGGRLLAGVGAELLLKGIFLKAGFSLRKPANPREDALAPLGSPESQLLNPRISVSFGSLLSEKNLSLLSNGSTLRPLIVTKWWRDEAAHSAVVSTSDTGVHLVRLALALRGAHDVLLIDADTDHAARIGAVLQSTGRLLGDGA